MPFFDITNDKLSRSKLKPAYWILFNFYLYFEEPWKGSVPEVYHKRTTDGSDLEVDTHYDASIFTTNLNNSDYNYVYGDIGSEFRVGGVSDEATSNSSNILRVWAR